MSIDAVEAACAMRDNKYARAFVVAAAHARTVAAWLCERIAREPLDPTLALRILLVAARDPDLKTAARAAAADVDFTPIAGPEVERLRAALA
jgi:hypothetical protein